VRRQPLDARSWGECPPLPAQWAPFRTINDRWRAWAVQHGRLAGAAYAWCRADFYRQWREKTAVGAESKLEANAPLTVIDIYPESEKYAPNFSLKGGHLTHIPSGRIHYNFHIRAAAPELPSSPSVATPAAREISSSARRRKGPTKPDRARAELLCEAARGQPGASAWKTDEAWRRGRDRFPESTLLNSLSPRMQRAAWQLAQELLKQERPKDPAEI
jgi:hypothetical protein